jgi:lipoprotein-releasing system ATP-binding protein
MNPVLELKNISKNFGSIEILKGVHLSVGSGEMIAILGPSGSGKSTLLHIAGLMERPTEGSVAISSQIIESQNEQQRAKMRLDEIGFLFQFHYLLSDFDVLENVLIPSRLAKDDLSASISYAKEILERLGLSHRLTHRPSQLSGGEQQRAALARALIRKPKILLCDEPTGNLDQKTARYVWDLIQSEIQLEKVATLIVTHNESLATEARKSYHLADCHLTESKFEVKT